MKIFTIVGARPNIIKIDPTLPQTIVHTGQHYSKEMSGQFFDELEMPQPAYNLGCKGDEVGKMIDELRKLFKKEKPDMVLVFGDTNSSLAGALAAAYENIKVAHVEAGLRSFNKAMPEEINRLLIDHIAEVLFCPNQNAALNLLREGIVSGVHVVGDPSFDAIVPFLPIKNTKERQTYLLLTLHRKGNVDDPERLQSVFDGLLDAGPVWFPAHPRTVASIRRFRIEVPKHVKMMKPKSHRAMLSLISNAKKVLTDSGGVQREAFWFNVPVIILREETEWLEIIAKGSGLLVGTDTLKIRNAIKSFEGTINPPPHFGANKAIKEILYKYA